VSFDRTPQPKSTEMSMAIHPKKGDDPSIDSQEFGDSKHVAGSNLTKNQQTLHPQSLNIPDGLPKSDLEPRKGIR